MNSVAIKSKQSFKYLLEINFYISVIILIGGGISSISGSQSFFEFHEDLYGAIDNNLRIMMAYLALAEISVVGYSYFKKNYRVIIPLGFFLLMMIGSLKVYSEINAITIDENFSWFFLYTGMSHLFYGLMMDKITNNPGNQN